MVFRFLLLLLKKVLCHYLFLYIARTGAALLLVAVVGLGRAEASRRRADLAVLLAAVTHNLRVNGAGDAVVQLGVQLRQRVRCELG